MTHDTEQDPFQMKTTRRGLLELVGNVAKVGVGVALGAEALAAAGCAQKPSGTSTDTLDPPSKTPNMSPSTPNMSPSPTFTPDYLRGKEARADTFLQGSIEQRLPYAMDQIAWVVNTFPNYVDDQSVDPQLYGFTPWDVTGNETAIDIQKGDALMDHVAVLGINDTYTTENDIVNKKYNILVPNVADMETGRKIAGGEVVKPAEQGNANGGGRATIWTKQFIEEYPQPTKLSYGGFDKITSDSGNLPRVCADGKTRICRSIGLTDNKDVAGIKTYALVDYTDKNGKPKKAWVADYWQE